MKKINFLFGIHCHQPVGNFEHVFDQAYNDCYLPFIQVMERHPRIKFTVHYSGILYDWFLDKHPEFLELLAKMVKRGQVEVMTGGYYEPIIPIIPEEDQLGQIKMESQFIQKHFKVSSTGMWLTERIWEPHLPKILHQAGVEYITVDDYHFISAGIEKDKLFSYYITEEQGATINVFPISKDLRYLVPFRLPHETIKYLSNIATEEGSRAAILADDGEKFGMWPGTKKWVYDDGYLENLLSEIEHNLEWIRPMKFSEYVEEFPAEGWVYLPTASYFEMMEWALPAKAQIRLEQIMKEASHHGKMEAYSEFFKGGFFRNFFVKYPESNNMHKKMLLVSQKLSTLKKTHTSEDRDKLLLSAERDLYMAQCNCAYWHGVFGGLYLSNLRHAVYEHLIRAENTLQKLQRGDKKYTELLLTDFDKDGSEEVIVSNPYLNLYFSPAKGGSLFELDYKPKDFNLLNVLTRREEAYHHKILNAANPNVSHQEGTKSIHDIVQAKEGNIQKYLIYDRHRRASLIDHFYRDDVNWETLKSEAYEEAGDFVGQRYNFFPARRTNEAQLNFSRTGKVLGKDVKINKIITLLSGQSIINVEYELTNVSSEHISAYFGVEFNLTLLASDAPDRYYKIFGADLKNPALNSDGILSKIGGVQLVDEWKGFSVSFELQNDSEFIRFPIETVSQSEGGFERTYQGSCLVFAWKLSLKPSDIWKNKIVVRIES